MRPKHSSRRAAHADSGATRPHDRAAPAPAQPPSIPPAQPAPTRHRRLLRRLALGLAILLALFVVDYYAYPYGAAPGGRSLNRGENGLWLRYTWYFGQKSDAEWAALAERLKRGQIRDAYFHVRGITRDGALKYRYPERARALVERMHRLAPAVRAVAWVYAGNRSGEGEVDLTRPEVRRRMVGEAAWLARECGFDGVQWDYEICPDGDQGFLDLMAETRRALPPRKLLGAACPVWLRFPVGRWGWSTGYYAKVAATCDQIAVMCYDTGFVTPRSYVWLTGREVVEITRAAQRGDPACRVLIGVPTYGAGSRSHNPRAENLAFALRGVREGLADPSAAATSFAGVALFADYTTDEAEWAQYERLWLR